MPLHSAMGRRFQAGPESTPGVGGTAAFRFPTLNFNLGPAGDAPIETRHAGGKEVGAVVMGDTWTAGQLGGGANQNIIDFNEAVFLASGNLNNPTPTASGAAITRVYHQDPDNTDTVLTYVVQRGDSSAVVTYRNVMIPSLGFNFVRRGASTVTGAAMGKQLVGGSSLDSATGIPQQSLASTKTGLYFPATFGGTLTSHRASPYGFSLEWHNNSKYAPDFVLDDSIVGPLGFLEGQVDHGGTLSLGWDISGSDFAGPFNLANMNAGTIIYVSVLNLGPVVPTTAIPYKLQLDLCVEISGAPTENTIDNVLTMQWPYRCVPDPTAGFASQLTIVSAVPIADTTAP
jgi:hypothetical protein